MIARKGQGMWVQPLILIIFAVLLVVTIFMFILSSRSIQAVDENVDDNLLEHRAHTVLTGLLRQPVPPVDLNGDGTRDKATLAEWIAVNAEHRTDDLEIRNFIWGHMPDSAYYLIFLRYSGTIPNSNNDYDIRIMTKPRSQQHAVPLKDRVETEDFVAFSIDPPGQELIEYLPTFEGGPSNIAVVYNYIPTRNGNIPVQLVYVDDTVWRTDTKKMKTLLEQACSKWDHCRRSRP